MTETGFEIISLDEIKNRLELFKQDASKDDSKKIKQLLDEIRASDEALASVNESFGRLRDQLQHWKGPDSAAAVKGGITSILIPLKQLVGDETDLIAFSRRMEALRKGSKGQGENASAIVCGPQDGNRSLDEVLAECRQIVVGRNELCDEYGELFAHSIRGLKNSSDLWGHQVKLNINLKIIEFLRQVGQTGSRVPERPVPPGEPPRTAKTVASPGIPRPLPARLVPEERKPARSVDKQDHVDKAPSTKIASTGVKATRNQATYEYLFVIWADPKTKDCPMIAMYRRDERGISPVTMDGTYAVPYSKDEYWEAWRRLTNFPVERAVTDFAFVVQEGLEVDTSLPIAFAQVTATKWQRGEICRVLSSNEDLRRFELREGGLLVSDPCVGRAVKFNLTRSRADTPSATEPQRTGDETAFSHWLRDADVAEATRNRIRKGSRSHKKDEKGEPLT